jgi:hypothetical protein
MDMALSSKITRLAGIGGLAAALVGTTLLVTGAAGSLAHELKPAGISGAAQISGQSTGEAVSAPAASQTSPQAMARPVAAGFAAQTRMQPSARMAWRTVGPWTHLGDVYSLILTNGPTPQQVALRVAIMDHRNHVNTVVLEERLQLAAGERRVLSATNEYGDANHFMTAISAQHGNLEFEVTMSDSSGAESARYNQRAFNFIDDLAQRAAEARARRAAEAQGEQARKMHKHGP